MWNKRILEYTSQYFKKVKIINIYQKETMQNWSLYRFWKHETLASPF